MRSVALVAVVSLAGCSFVWTKPVQRPTRPPGETDAAPVCSISYAPPIVDFALAAATYMLSIYYVYEAALGESYSPTQDLIVAGGSAGLGVLFTASGIVGNGRVSECRELFGVD